MYSWQVHSTSQKRQQGVLIDHKTKVNPWPVVGIFLAQGTSAWSMWFCNRPLRSHILFFAFDRWFKIALLRSGALGNPGQCYRLGFSEMGLKLLGQTYQHNNYYMTCLYGVDQLPQSSRCLETTLHFLGLLNQTNRNRVSILPAILSPTKFITNRRHVHWPEWPKSNDSRSEFQQLAIRLLCATMQRVNSANTKTCLFIVVMCCLIIVDKFISRGPKSF